MPTHPTSEPDSWHARRPQVATRLFASAHAGRIAESVSDNVLFSPTTVNHLATRSTYSSSSMRPQKLPKISTFTNTENMENETRITAIPCLAQSSPGHSRNSSGVSIKSTPMTPTFSSRGHSRWPSSSSSLATSPDSPVNMGKSSLDDLVEEPGEMDDLANQTRVRSSIEEFCICKLPLRTLKTRLTNFHRRHYPMQASAGIFCAFSYAASFITRMDTGRRSSGFCGTSEISKEPAIGR